MYITIGRNPQSNIVITGYDVVSFDHATIEYANNQFLFIDDSSNGTLVNGKLIHHASCPITQNDVVMLAGVCPLKWEQILAQIPQQSQQPQMMGRPTQLHSPEQQYNQPQYGQPQYNNQPNYSQQQNGQYNQQQYAQSPSGSYQQAGGNDKQSSFDERDIDKWHWGAFFLSWIWGIFNNVYWPLIALIPIPLLGLVVSIIVGIKGRRQSWENGRWRPEDYDRFAQKQKGWSIAGIIIFGIGILSTIIFWSMIASTLSILANL